MSRVTVKASAGDGIPAVTGRGGWEPPAGPSGVKALLRTLGVLPSRRLGQNFLCDGDAHERIAALAGIAAGDPVLEVGPGLGHLTARLLDAGAVVTAVELDHRLFHHLREAAALATGLTLVQGDALAGKHALGPEVRAWLEGLTPERPGRVVANLPYQIASPLLVLLLASGAPLVRLVACLQLEVARRLVAEPGTSDYGALTVLVRYRARVEIALRLGTSRFWPQPQVESAVVVIEPTPPSPPARDDADFARFVHAAFGQRRKTLAAALRHASWNRDRGGEATPARVQRLLVNAHRPADTRAEALSTDELVRLYDELVAGA